MFDKLEAVEARYEELTKAISDPEVIAKQAEWQKLIKEHSSIEEVVLKYREYKKEKQRMADAKDMMEDKELKELAEADYYEAKEKLPHIEEELKTLFVRFVAVLVEKRQHYLRLLYLECIQCMQKKNIGK